MRILIIIVVLILVLHFVPVGLYFKAKSSGVKISLWILFLYNRKNLPISLIIEWNAKLISRDFNVDFKNLVSQYNVGIDMDNVVAGMVLAKENNLPITFDQACEADAKGIDLVKTVKNRISYVD